MALFFFFFFRVTKRSFRAWRNHFFVFLKTTFVVTPPTKLDMAAVTVVEEINWAEFWNDPDTADVRLICRIQGKDTVYHLHYRLLATLPYFKAAMEAARSDAIAESAPTVMCFPPSSSSSVSCSSSTTVSTLSSLSSTSFASFSSSATSPGESEKKGNKRSSIGMEQWLWEGTDPPSPVSTTHTHTTTTTHTPIYPTSVGISPLRDTPLAHKKQKMNDHLQTNGVSDPSLHVTSPSPPSLSLSSLSPLASAPPPPTVPSSVMVPSLSFSFRYRRVLDMEDPYVTDITVSILRSLYTGSLELPTTIKGWVNLFREGMRLQLRKRTLKTWLKHMAELACTTHLYQKKADEEEVKTITSEIDKSHEKEKKEEKTDVTEIEPSVSMDKKNIAWEKRCDDWVQLLHLLSSFYSVFRESSGMKNMVGELWWCCMGMHRIPRHTQPHHLSVLLRAHMDTHPWDTACYMGVPTLMRYCQEAKVDTRRLGEHFYSMLPHMSSEDVARFIHNGVLARMGLDNRECTDALVLRAAMRTHNIPQSRPEVYPPLFSDTLSSSTFSRWDRRAARLLFEVGPASEDNLPRNMAWAHARLVVGEELHVTFECLNYTFSEGKQQPRVRLGLQPLFSESADHIDCTMPVVSFLDDVDNGTLHTHAKGISKGDVWEFKVKRDAEDKDVNVSYRGPTTTSSWRQGISRMSSSVPLHVMAEVIENGEKYTLEMAVRYP